MMTTHSFKWRWAHVDESEHTMQYVALLNHLRADDDPAHFPNTMAWIDAQPGERLLELGCGNGAVARAVAQQQPAIREIVAIDASAAMIAAAQQHMQAKALPNSFQVADAHHLPFPDASFDRCYAQELFVILSDPQQALAEMMRVTRPGGHLCLWESECDMHALLSDNDILARRLMHFVGEYEYNGGVARQMIGWLKAEGWQMDITPAVSVSEDGGVLLATLLPEWLTDALHAGVITDAEKDSFLDEMQQRQQNGLFFSYIVNFRITARKPV